MSGSCGVYACDHCKKLPVPPPEIEPKTEAMTKHLNHLQILDIFYNITKAQFHCIIALGFFEDGNAVIASSTMSSVSFKNGESEIYDMQMFSYIPLPVSFTLSFPSTMKGASGEFSV